MERINRQFQNIIPRELESEIKFNKFFSLSNLLTIVATMVISGGFADIVHPALQGYFTIFSVLVGLFMILPADKSNAYKKNWHLALFIISKKMVIYKSICYDEKEDNANAK